MIDSIELSNWKTHRHTVMHFQKGVNVLIGIMGSGKSSIMDALSFALFGTFPALIHKKITVKELIMKRPSDNDSAEVKLTFTVGRDVYRVTRIISKRNPTASKLEMNGTYLQTQSERVNEEISSLLKMDYDTFSRAVYSEQNMMDYFLELPKSERKRQIDQMLGLDSFARAEENCTTLVNSIRGEIKSYEETLSGYNLAEMKAEIGRISSDRNMRESEVRTIISEASVISSELKGLEARQKNLKELQDKKRKLLDGLTYTKSRIDTINAELSRIDEKEGTDSIATRLDSLKASSVAVEERRRAAKTELSSLLKKIAEIGSERASIMSQKDEAAKAEEELKRMPLDKIDEDIEKEQKLYDGTLKNITISQSQLDEANSAIAELKKAHTKCPICDRELSAEAKNALLAKKSQGIETFKTEIDACRVSIKHADERLRKLRSMRTSASLNAEIAKKLKQHIARIGELDIRLAEARNLNKSSEEAFEAIEKELELGRNAMSTLSGRLERAKMRDRYMDELKRLGELLTKSRSEADLIVVDDLEVESTNRALIDKSKTIGELESKASGIEKLISSIDAHIKEKAKAIAKIEETEYKLEGRRVMLSNLNKFKGALIDAESALRLRLIGTINSTMQSIWLQLYPYGDYISIRLLAGGDNYELQYATGTDIGGGMIWQDIQGVASGGERSIASLAMRISIATVIVPNLKWLILDEPTHNIDENGIIRITNVLGESLPNIVEQVFVITHDSAMKNIAGAKIYQLGRDKSIHEPTISSEI